MIDWAEVNFIIGTNPDSFIEIKFDQKSIDTEMGLKAYMNTLIKSHDVISQFNLRRIIKFWGYKDGSYVYFMLAPPWIKFNPGITYAGVLNQQLDEVHKSELGSNSNRNSNDDSSVRDDFTTGRDKSKEEERKLTEGMSDSAQNLFKIHQLVFKKSSFIKEPMLYSKDIPV